MLNNCIIEQKKYLNALIASIFYYQTVNVLYILVMIIEIFYTKFFIISLNAKKYNS